eukprot:scaffold15407_cov21-Tisochrysis_lutea.AAC.5
MALGNGGVMHMDKRVGEKGQPFYDAWTRVGKESAISPKRLKRGPKRLKIASSALFATCQTLFTQPRACCGPSVTLVCVCLCVRCTGRHNVSVDADEKRPQKEGTTIASKE